MLAALLLLAVSSIALPCPENVVKYFNIEPPDITNTPATNPSPVTSASATTFTAAAGATGVAAATPTANSSPTSENPSPTSEDRAPPPQVDIPAPRWIPTTNTPWQVVLNGQQPRWLAWEDTADTPVYDTNMFTTPLSNILEFKKSKPGTRVICYFSAGAYEDNLPDSSGFLASEKGSYVGSTSKLWLNIASENVRNIMAGRIAMASERGCDAIDPDDIGGFMSSNGLGLTQAQAVDYLTFLTQTAAGYGMATGLRNANPLVSSMLSIVHFAIVTDCAQSKSCGDFSAFTGAGKAVFNIEYLESPLSRDQKCAAEKQWGFQTALKRRALDEYVEYCDGRSFTGI